MNELSIFRYVRAMNVVGSAKEGQHKKFNARKKNSLAPRSALAFARGRVRSMQRATIVRVVFSARLTCRNLIDKHNFKVQVPSAAAAQPHAHSRE
jgi:hypothetical protein